MSHTPGPWKVNSLDWREVVEQFGQVVADVRRRDDDAHLIAAAPELLEALERCVEIVFHDDFPGSDEAYDKARIAIAKAKGEA